MTSVRQVDKATIGRQPPSPKGNFLFGHVLDFRRDILETFTKAQRSHGDVVLFRAGRLPLYMVCDPDLAGEILVEGKQRFRKISRPERPVGLQLILGNGLLTNPDHESWLSQRRMMQPMFHRQRILAMGDKMLAAGERMLDRWKEKYRSGQAFDLAEEMMQVTLDIVSQTMFSNDVMDEVDMVAAAVTTAVHYVTRIVNSPINLPLGWPTPANVRFRRAKENLDELIYRLIRERRAAGGQSGDLLDMLLEARDEETGQRMSDEQVRDEVMTVFGAGHETTANALSWTWYLLAQHPEQLARLQEELDRVLAGRRPTVTDLPSLPFTRQVLEESLRLYPPAPLVPRRASEKMVLGEYEIAADALVVIGVYNLHHDPRLWPEPERFDPDRFGAGGQSGGHRYAYMPFGSGPHLCIGNNFALVEGQLLLALMAQAYELRLVSGRPVEKDVAVTMRPRHGLQVTLHPR